jgi:hypothetical protein
MLAALLLAPVPLAAVDPTGTTAQQARSRANDSRVGEPTHDQPIRFEANRGQADPRVRYISRARDYTVALTDDEALLLVRRPATPPHRRLEASDMALLRMRLTGASPAPRITASDPLTGKVFLADAAARGPLTPIETFARVAYAGVYPGIDLIYYGHNDRLEFDFVVAPFADPDQIGLSLQGADGITLTDAGDLSMRVGGAEVRLEKPFVYQNRGGGRVEVAGSYVLPTDDTPTVRLRLGRYDPSLPLVIDPTWMTVFGSTNEDWLSEFAVDSAGHPRVLGETFDPATFPYTQLEPGLLPAPICFLSKFDGTTGLTIYTVLFANTQSCGTLALAPSDLAYFTGFVYPNGFHNNQGTTITVVGESGGVPAISRFGVANYDSSAIGEGVDALAVNSYGQVFLLGPCRQVGPGDPPLNLSGYNDTPDPAQGTSAVGCTVPNPGFSELYQPVLTVVDSSGNFLYGSFLSPGEPAGRYGLAADDAGLAYIVGAETPNLPTTPDAYRAVCPVAGTRGFDRCGYLMVLDTTITGSASLAHATYLWNTENVETMAIRLGPAGELYVASEGRIFDDFPSNRPTNPVAWSYSLYPTLREGIQLARFIRDPGGMPSQFDFAMIFDPSRPVAALAGHTVREALAGLSLFPSGAPAVASVAYTQTLAPMGIVTTFAPGGDRLGEVWARNLGTRSPIGFGVAATSGRTLFLAGQIEAPGTQNTELFVERIDAVDPANRPPTVSIFENVTTIYADSPTAGALLQLNAIASDPDGDTLTYSWSGPFTDNPVTTNHFIIARVPLGPQQTVTVTVDDGHGNIASFSRSFDVVGTPFVGTTATPIDSTINGLVFNYAPVTITAAGIGGGGGNAYLRSRLDQNPPIPANLQAGSPPIYFELSTDAILIAPFTVCVDTRGMSFANPANIRLYHYRQFGQLGLWTDITSAGQPQGDQLCGESNTLGTFAIFYPQVPATAVQTIAGNGVLERSNDGFGGNPIDDYQDGPATSTALNYLFGGAYDRANNRLFVSDGSYILRVNLNDNTIARVGGNGVGVPGGIDGPGGDLRDDLVEGGDAFATYFGNPAELVISPAGDVVFFDRSTCLVRRLDVTQGRVYTLAGNGACGFSGDGSTADLASLSFGQMAFDAAGNLFLAAAGNEARVRRIDALTNVIDTVAGDGAIGTPVNGASARSTIGIPLGIAFDAEGHLLIAAGMHLVRVSTGAQDALVDGDADELITVIGGCNTNCQSPFNGDGLAISHPQVYLSGMGHLTVAADGSVLLSDSFRVRRILPGADGIMTGAGDEIISTIAGYYDWERFSQIPNFNGDTFSTQSRFSHTLIPVADLQGRVIVVDGNNFRVRRFVLAVGGGSPLSIQTAALPGAIEGSPYSVAVAASGGTAAGYNWAIAAGALPAGLVLASAGTPSTTISGTPTEAGTFDFTVRVTDSNGGTVMRAFTLVVDAALIIDTLTVPTATEGGAYSAPITASGGTGVGYTWSITAGALPAGLVLAPAGTPSTTISGTPTAHGTFGFTLGVVDSAGSTTTRAFTLVVDPATVLINVAEWVVVSDGVGVLPSAMIGVDEQILVSDGPVVQPSVMIDVSEAIAVSDEPQLTVDNVAPVLTVPADIVAETQTPAGAAVTFVATATDNSGTPPQLVCAPASGSIFPFGGSGPTTTIVTCTATDGSGNTATRSFNVVVQDTTAPQVITAQLTVAATEATGARGNVPQAPHTPLLQQIPLLAAALDAGDQNPARASVQWVACGNPAQVLGPIADTTLYPVGPNCFQYLFRDGSGNVGTGVGTIEVSPPIGGHVNVPDVSVTATDLNNVPVPVTATYLGLDQAGLLTAVPPQFILSLPAGLVFAGAPYDVRSTALSQAPVVVCVQPPAGEIAERLFAFEQFQWVDRTERLDAATGAVCGRPGPLGVFAATRRDLSTFTLTLTPPSATVPLEHPHTVEALVADQSDLFSRVALYSGTPVNVEFRDPLVANAALSVTVHTDASGTPPTVIVTLATGAAGQIVSTARQVADAINAAVLSQTGLAGVLFANPWPGTNGEGIAEPRPMMRLALLRVSTDPPSGGAECYISLPGWCSPALAVGLLSSVPYTSVITAHLDLNHNGTIEAAELTATAGVTWVDVLPPALGLPANITVLAAAPAGSVVTFTVTAFDMVDGNVTPSCSHASGSTFPIGVTTVTCTATDASGNVGTGSFTVTVSGPTVPPPSLHLPGNITVIATGPSGAVVDYTATATASAFGASFTFPATCTPASGSTFPIGTTTVNCSASNPFLPGFGFPATGSFTVTVTVGTPGVAVFVPNKGRDPDGTFWVDLLLLNTGTGYARTVSIASLTLRTLVGTGTVTFNAGRTGPLPLNAGAIGAGGTRVIRVYLNVPPTVRRFSITEHGSAENVNGSATLNFSPMQAVIP